MSNLIGHSLGRYQILEQLGEGGMAIVYKAYDTRLESDVAVKVIRTERLAPEILQRAMKRFEREAKSLAQLTHPNLVKVLDYGEYEGQPYLVMPYLPGGTLKQKIKGQPMPWQEAARLLIPIARALDYAHKRNLIHRDVKPSNILITESGEPMLTDFGVAKIIDEEATLDLTGTSAAVGTPEYMAPEQATSKNVDRRVDIYALGIVFYEMVTGRRPFQADTPLAVLFKQASEPLPRPSLFVTNLPKSVEKILLKALAKRREDRYQEMGEVANAMESLVSGIAQEVKPQPASVKPQPARSREKTRDTLATAQEDAKATIHQDEGKTVENAIVSNLQRPVTKTVRKPAPSGILRYWPFAVVGIVAFVAILIASPQEKMVPSVPTSTATAARATLKAWEQTATARVAHAQEALAPYYTEESTRIAIAGKTGTVQAIQATAAKSTKVAVEKSKTEVAALCIPLSNQCFEVQANNSWQNTSIYVRAGQTLLIQYSFGRWSACAKYGCPYVDANGNSNDPLDWPDNIIQNCRNSTLIAKVGNTIWCTGNLLSKKAVVSGTLQLRMNDIVLSDNDGSITVHITIKP
jgi:serine/threonine protein kinase